MGTSTDTALLFAPRKLSVADLPSASATIFSNAYQQVWDGEKYATGMGGVRVLWKDYWTLRQRSVELFERNLYARGMVRRLVTNEINTGLDLEVAPEEGIIGREEGSLDEWSEDIENRWRIWARSPGRCDALQQRGFGRLQASARMEALISGDVLVVLTVDRATGLPRVRLIDGQAVQTPSSQPRPGHRIIDGVELDKMNRQVAYWILQEDGEWKRLPAWGEKSGRRLSWLVYGTEKREHETRGTPMLSIIMQSLAELDRYRDSTQRKAVINSMLAMFIQKDEERAGTRPLTGAAIRRTAAQTVSGDGAVRSFNAQEHLPGLTIDELAVGEKPMAFGNAGIDEKFSDFEEALVASMAWHFECPPEIMTLAFSSNYSASQAAINEFKMYLNKVRTHFGEQFCKPIYGEWLIAQALTGRVQAPEVLQAWRDSSQYDVFGAWISSEWAGHIKPSTDLIKQAKGYELLLQHGLITYDLATKELTGTKFSKNVKKQKAEREALAELNEIMAAPEREAAHENALEIAEKSAKDDRSNGTMKKKEAQLANSLEALLSGKDVEVLYG
jgi:lambda family phage portal protein